MAAYINSQMNAGGQASQMMQHQNSSGQQQIVYQQSLGHQGNGGPHARQDGY
jgi:hypothetical protein